jgi:hypothetical protein
MRNWIGLVVMCLAIPMAAGAQDKDVNPVSSSMRELFNRFSTNIAAAAEEMPADKYNFHPTAGQQSFGTIIEHVTESNYLVCSMISDSKPPAEPAVTAADPKDKLVTALKASFQYCAASTAKLQDTQMGDPITFLGGRKTPRARAVLELPVDLSDHYSQLAAYLRANGLLPPTAQPRK